MSDALYLSLWYPNLRLEGLPDKLAAVLGEFVRHGGESRVYSATAWPVNWHETPVFQRVWGRAARPVAEELQGPAELGAEPRQAVEETLDLLHEDYAYEFQIGWALWELQATGSREQGTGNRQQGTGNSHPGDMDPSPGTRASQQGTEGQPEKQPQILRSAQDDNSEVGAASRWARVTRLVRVTGYGPLFDEGAYEQDGHIRIEFGSDAPFLEEGVELDSTAARHIADNVRQLVDLTNAVEKASGATARLLWSELGESLAQKLAQRLAAMPGGQGN
jgi:hypothetical protein